MRPFFLTCLKGGALLGLTLIVVACNTTSFSGADALSIRPANVLTPQQPNGEVEISNPTRGAVAWGLQVQPDAANAQTDWVDISSLQGTLGGGAATTVQLKLRGDLSPGLYLSKLGVRYGDAEETFVLAGQVPGGPTGTAGLEGLISTENALIPVPGAPAPLPEMQTTPEAQNQQPYVPGQILVKYKESANDQTLNAQQLSGGALAQRQALVQSLQTDYALRVLESRPPGESDLLATSQDVETVAAALNADPRVEYATPNYYLNAFDLPKDPLVEEQFALAMAGLPAAWTIEDGSSNPVTVAVLDTGFDLNHEDLVGRFLPGYDFCAKYENTGTAEKSSFVCQGADDDPGFGLDSNSHGTHVSGILAAVGNNNRGVSGVAYGSTVKIVPVKIFADNGVGANLDTFTKGIKWAVGLSVTGAPLNKNPARVINLSLGGAFFEKDKDDNPDNNPVNGAAVRFMQDAVNAAISEGVLVVAATGNESQSYIFSPAAADKVLAVGSVDVTLERSSFSNYSEKQLFGPGVVDLMAPGNGILSTFPNNDYSSLPGTSMSAPLVAGVAALLLSREPQLSPEELEQRLLAGAYFDSAVMTAAEHGKGILRADLTFGLPGPGSDVTVAVGTPEGSSALTTTTLDFYASPIPFTLPNLAAGNYRVVTLSNGKSGQLFNTQTISVAEGETKALSVQLSKP
jgi:subtilisin family serine protease